MPITAAQARCNAKALRKFGALVQLDGVEIPGDFSAATKDREVAGVFVNASDPACIVLDGDVPASPVGKPFVNELGEAFTIMDLKSDDLGLTVLILQVGL